MKLRAWLLALCILMLSCNFASQLDGGNTATPEAPPAATPTQIQVEVSALPEATATAVPEETTADLVGPAEPPNASGEWPIYNSGNTVMAVLADGDTLWAGTTGGVVRWNLADGSYERFTAADGLALTEVYDLALSQSGQLWAVGTQGAAVFDGETWRNIPQSEMGLPDSPLRAVAVEGEGAVWVGGDEFFDYGEDIFYMPAPEETLGGVARLSGDTWELFDVVGDGLLSNQINDLVIGNDNSLWVASGLVGNEPTPGGISRRNPADGSWTHYTIDDGLDGFAFGRLAFDSAGMLWAGGRRGLSWCDVSAPGTPCRVDSPNGQHWQTLQLFNVQAIAFDPDGTLWIGTYTGLYEFRESALTPVVGAEELSFYAVAAPAPADVWLGTDASLVHLQGGGTLDRRYTADGPLNNTVLALATAEDSSLWVRSRGGISRLAGDRWEHWLDEQKAAEAAYPWPLNREGLWPVDSEGGLWLLAGATAQRFDGTTWTDVSHPDGELYVLAADPGGGMWAVNQTALLRYLGGAWQTVASVEGLENFFGVSDLLVDSQGIVWMSSAVPYIDGGGVYRWDGSAWEVFNEEDGLAGNATGDLALAPDGQLWAAHNVRGLSRFDGTAWQIEVADPETLGLGADGFNAITFVDQDTAWFRLEAHCGFEGTCVSGFARREGDQWTAYHAEPGGLPTDFIADLAVTEAGEVWLGTFLGLVAVPSSP